MNDIWKTLGVTSAFVALGVICFVLAFFIISKLSPYSMKKEIEEDQNTALAIIIAAVILGIAHIIASALHG